jgi:deoxyxylulose-5-phosphate synthase
VSRTPMKLAAVMLAAGITVAACGSVKMGAAAITTSQRISTTTLSTQVANLNTAYQAHKKQVQLQYPVSEMPQQVLSWLVRFQVGDQLAAQHGITVSPTEAQEALAAIAASLKQNGSSETLTEAAVANGLPPDMLNELGRYQAIETKLLSRLDGGQEPTSTAGQQALQAEFNKTQCQAAKSLNIQINPQFGAFDYSSNSVVLTPSGLSKEAVPAPSPSASSKPVLTPPC